MRIYLHPSLKYLFLSISLGVISTMCSGDVRAAQPLIQEFRVPDETSSPHSIAVDPSGNVWFAEKVGKSLSMFDPEQNAFKVYHLPEDWGNVGPSLLATGPKGEVWFSVKRWAASEDDTSFLGQFDPAAGSFHKHPLSTAEEGGARTGQNGVKPDDLLVDRGGVVWFLSPDENKLYSFDSGGAGLRGFPIPTPNCYPRGIAIDQAGAIWFAEANENKIAKFDPFSAQFSEFEIPTAFANPGMVAVDGAGKVWFVEMSANRLGVFYPDLARFDEALLPSKGSMPSAIGADGDGKIWFLEYMGNNIGFFDPVKSTFKQFTIPTSSSLPGDMVIDLERGRLWFSETNTEAKRLGMLSIEAALLDDGSSASGAAARNLSPGASRATSGGDSFAALITGLALFAAALGGFVIYARRRRKA